jgi:hypothetical protein
VSDASCRDTLISLASALKEYGAIRNDPFILKTPKIQADIQWCMAGGTEAYNAAVTPKKTVKKNGKRARKKRKRE